MIALGRVALGRVTKAGGTVALWVFAIAGWFTWVVGPLVAMAFHRVMYATERTRVVASPDGGLRVAEEVTRGGLGTVWTTRLFVEDGRRGARGLIYENRDSDFSPPLRWATPQLLIVCVPADRVDYLASPFAYAPAPDALGRLVVHVTYCAAGRRPSL